MYLHVLLAGPNHALLQTVESTLTPSDRWNVALTSTTEQVKTAIEAGAADIVLLEVSQQEAATFLETAHALNEHFNRIPFILLTGTQDSSHTQQATQLHPFALLPEPWPGELLQKTLSSAADYLESTATYQKLKHTDTFRLFDVAKIPMCLTDQRGRFVNINEAFIRLYGYSAQEIVGKHFTSLLPDNIKAYAAKRYQAYMENPNDEDEGTWQARNKNGELKDIRTLKSVFTTPEGDIFQLTIATDLTAPLHETKQMKHILEVHRSQIKDLNHQFKNTLNIITGLLFLQSEKVRERTDVFRLFQEAINRVQAVSLVHEHHTDSPKSAQVYIQKYLTDVCMQSKMAHAAVSPNVQLHHDIEDFKLPVHQAIPCGLFINEALSNSYQHGFDPGHAGSIRITVVKRAAEVTIAIEDTGKGLPADFDITKANTLGVQLMKTLASQLHAAFSLQTKQGTSIELRFRVEP